MTAKLVEAKSEAGRAEAGPDDEAPDDTPDYAAFKAGIRRRTGIDLNLYKAQQMRRRLTGLLERAHVATFGEYLCLLERDTDEWNVFLDRMTINVSELFRNPEKWDDLRRPILSEWLNPSRAPAEANAPAPAPTGAKSDAASANVSGVNVSGVNVSGVNVSSSAAAMPAPRPFKAWSAGCSYGAEPYSLAILLDQGWPGARTTLHATDLDRVILARAAQGRFKLADTKNVAPQVLREYFTPIAGAAGVPTDRAPAKPTGRAFGELPDPLPSPLSAPSSAAICDDAYQVRPDIGRRVLFRQHNLLADAFETDYDLICCRNVVIYFTDAAKQTLYKRFHQALRVGGVLWVGSTERIFNFQELGFEMPLPFFYRRVR